MESLAKAGVLCHKQNPFNFKWEMPMKSLYSALLSSVIFLAAPGFASSEKPATAAGKDYVILKVGGDEIKKSYVMEIWQGLFPEGEAPDFDSFDENVKQNVLRGVVSEHLINEQAEKAGLENDPEILGKVAQFKKKLVIQTFLDKKASQAVSEDQLRAAYNEEVKKQAGKKEVRARHILVSSEDQAEEIKEKLDDGEKFEDLAKQLSTDKGSAVSGGDLGYFTEGEMVPEFTKAAFELKKGEVSDPVKTDFGWHIIKVEDVRDVAVPTYAEMKDKLRDQIKGEALKSYINELIDTAKVEYFSPKGENIELTRTPDKASQSQEAPESEDKAGFEE